LRKYLESKGLWNNEKEKDFNDTTRKSVLKAFSRAEKLKKPSINELFTDVYDEVLPHLKEQQDELKRILETYPEHFNTDAHAK
jgi:2-oxoisovalerate dehydrogenase E1 component alpha subunit